MDHDEPNIKFVFFFFCDKKNDLVATNKFGKNGG